MLCLIFWCLPDLEHAGRLMPVAKHVNYETSYLASFVLQKLKRKLRINRANSCEVNLRLTLLFVKFHWKNY